MAGTHRRPRSRVLGVVLVVAVTGGAYALGQAAWADPGAENLTPAETVSAISEVDPSNATVADVTPAAGGDFVSDSHGTQVEIARDPAVGIDFSGPGTPALTIKLPGAGVARDARAVGDTVVFEAAAPSTDIAVQTTDGGGVRQLLTIAAADAPTSYASGIEIPGGGSVRLADDGGAIVVDQAGVAVAQVPAPWAKDASGAAVPTHFTADGATLTQHIDHAGATYPVVADPWFWNYMGCITGIGVPIGAAIVIASYPPSWWHVQKMASGTLATGRVNGIVMYANWVKTRCGAFLRS